MNAIIGQESALHAAFDARDCRPFVAGRDYDLDELETLMPLVGIGFNPGVMNRLAEFSAMDGIQQPYNPPSIPSPIQFLQNWLPGVVDVITAAREIDEIVGVSTIGAWEDEQIIQRMLETTGSPAPYGDNNLIPLANWNIAYIARTVVRFELGLKVGPLEEARSARIQQNSGDIKRGSAALQLEIQRNAVGFFGYNNGANFTYGLLNDPNLPNYVTVATGASGQTTWATKTFLEIQADILTALQALRVQSQGVIKPNQTSITMVLPYGQVDYLAKTSDFGISVWGWLKEFYANVRVITAPQFTGANGGANVFYIFADSVDDGTSSDDKRTFVQIVPAKFQLLGVAKLAKGYEEDYSNATAGVLCKRPYAVVRRSGI